MRSFHNRIRQSEQWVLKDFDDLIRYVHEYWLKVLLDRKRIDFFHGKISHDEQDLHEMMKEFDLIFSDKSFQLIVRQSMLKIDKIHRYIVDERIHLLYSNHPISKRLERQIFKSIDIFIYPRDKEFFKLCWWCYFCTICF